VAVKPELIAIVGPTASGKTSLAIEIAEQWNGEIICADSRTVYKGMDIGTAKPSPEDQARVRHWGIDLVEPNVAFTAADFQTYAKQAIADIRARGKLPILVGGTGLYVDAVLYDFTFGPPPDVDERTRLEAMSIEELIAYCNQHSILLPENTQNKRHLVRAIERKSINAISKNPLPSGYTVVGLATKMLTLRTRIADRTEHFFEQGVAKEATLLGKKYGWNSEAMTGNIYPLMHQHLLGKVTLSETKDLFTTADYQLAKRQMTWLRRNPDIEWVALTEAKSYIQSLLASE